MSEAKGHKTQFAKRLGVVSRSLSMSGVPSVAQLKSRVVVDVTTPYLLLSVTRVHALSVKYYYVDTHHMKVNVARVSAMTTATPVHNHVPTLRDPSLTDVNAFINLVMPGEENERHKCEAVVLPCRIIRRIAALSPSRRMYVTRSELM